MRKETYNEIIKGCGEIDKWCGEIATQIKKLLIDVAKAKENSEKEVIKEFAKTIITVLWEEERGETIKIKDLHQAIRDIANAQYGVEVE